MTTTYEPFPMYDLSEVARAHDLLWHRFVATVRRSGFAGDASLTQTCGYPLVTSLRDAFEALASPVYDVPFSNGATHIGLIVVAAEAPYARVEDLRGTRFALNAWDSNTGMNLPRRLIAPLASGGRFFRTVVETGSHLASIAAIQTGTADVASIDNVTFALLAQHRPRAIAAVRVLATTAPSPTLPFVVPVSTKRSVKTLFYDALAGTIDDLRRSESLASLGLVGIERASLSTYEPLLRFESESVELGYGVLA